MKIKFLLKILNECDADDEVFLMIKKKEGEYKPILKDLTVEIQKQEIEKIKRPSQMLNTRDAAMYIGMSPSYLRKAICEGQIGNRTKAPKFIKIGKAVRYSIQDLDKWIEINKSKS